MENITSTDYLFSVVHFSSFSAFVQGSQYESLKYEKLILKDKYFFVRYVPKRMQERWKHREQFWEVLTFFHTYSLTEGLDQSRLKHKILPCFKSRFKTFVFFIANPGHATVFVSILRYPSFLCTRNNTMVASGAAADQQFTNDLESVCNHMSFLLNHLQQWSPPDSKHTALSQSQTSLTLFAYLLPF